MVSIVSWSRGRVCCAHDTHGLKSSVNLDEVYAHLRAYLRVIPYARAYVAHDVMAVAAALSFIVSVFEAHRNDAT